jgi:Family of unknown function (DUF6279)
MMRWTAIIGATSLALALAGCSAARIGYNNAPTLVYYWLDGYLDFDGPQSLALRESLQSLQDWHRKEEVPLIAELLTNLQPSATQNVTPEEVCKLYSYVRDRATAPLERLAPALARVGSSLTAAQLTHLAAQYDKRNTSWREEWLDATPLERTERRLKQVVERAEGFYGNLTDAQRKLLKAQMDAAGFDPVVQYGETVRRQQDSLRTLALIRNGAMSQTQALTEIQNLLARSVTSPDPAYRRYQAQTSQQSCAAVAALHNSSNSAQREKMLEALKSYTADARALMLAR